MARVIANLRGAAAANLKGLALVDIELSMAQIESQQLFIGEMLARQFAPEEDIPAPKAIIDDLRRRTESARSVAMDEQNFEYCVRADLILADFNVLARDRQQAIALGTKALKWIEALSLRGPYGEHAELHVSGKWGEAGKASEDRDVVMANMTDEELDNPS